MSETSAQQTNKPAEARPCPRCQGSGKCPDCQGTGFIDCLSCSGKGKEKGFVCPSCQGQGKMPCPPLCPSCGGKGTITPAYQKEIRQKYQSKRGPLAPGQLVSSALGIICIVAYLVAPPDWSGVLPQELRSFVIHHLQNTPRLMGWQFSLKSLLGFITPVFLHGSWWHLLANMWFLYSIGPELERHLGSKRFGLLCLLSALGGNFCSWYFNFVPGIGASTVLYGLGMAFPALYWRDGSVNRQAAYSMLAWLGGFLILGFLLRSHLPFDNWGHLGGALGGMLAIGLTVRKA